MILTYNDNMMLTYNDNMISTYNDNMILTYNNNMILTYNDKPLFCLLTYKDKRLYFSDDEIDHYALTSLTTMMWTVEFLSSACTCAVTRMLLWRWARVTSRSSSAKWSRDHPPPTTGHPPSSSSSGRTTPSPRSEIRPTRQVRKHSH